MKQKQILTGVIALIVGLGVGYVAGHAATPAKTNLTAGAFSGRMGGTMRSGAGAGLLAGTIASKDATSITLDTRDGSSHVVLINPSTTVQKSVAGSLGDIVTGSTVVVMGTTNGDGSVSATSIQLRPAGSVPSQGPMMPAPQQ